MYTLAELAEIIKAEFVGDANAVINRAQSFAMAQAGDVTFATDKSYRLRLDESAATAVIIAPPTIENAKVNLLIAKNPKLAFARAVQTLHALPYKAKGVSEDLTKGEDCVLGANLSIHPRVTFGRGVIIGDRVTLHSGVVIGDNCRIGDDSVIYANVSIYANCEIGKRVFVHAGTVIGADGFGFVADEAGRLVKLLQLGRVIIEDDCEIGANCTIDRGGFEDTILRRGVKLDNLIQVGHNTQIGEDSVVAALAGFSGGTNIGRNCIIAGQVGTNQHITIGDKVIVTGQTGVTKDIPAGAIIGGMSQDLREWRRSQVLFAKLPELQQRLKQLEKKMEKIISEEEA
jgi:UDP-3-O-[3-hydroxymyristoyl] glucosamine N-acyltransferase